jgi:hypothetical protein
VSGESHELATARELSANAAKLLQRSQAFRQLTAEKQAAILGDLGKIHRALAAETAVPADPYALTLETPDDFRARLNAARHRGGANGAGNVQPSAPGPAPAPQDSGPSGPRVAATETLAARAGALSDEINFPAFVAALVHGTFDAIVDATIRQMEAFGELVSAVAKDVDEFTRDNVTPNQVRDWLVQQYPRDLALVPPGADGGEPRLTRRNPPTDDEEPPAWLAQFGLDGQALTDELIEDQLVPAARGHVGENRQQLLATMVLLGMSRVNVKDGTIAARVRFRAAARDKAAVDYAVSQDPSSGPSTVGQRGSSAYEPSSMMVSTVGVNVQADTELNAELFGEVKINFVSETLPLDRFVDSARMRLVQRNARSSAGAPAPAPAPAPPAASDTPPAAPSAPATPATPVAPVPPPPAGPAAGVRK